VRSSSEWCEDRKELKLPTLLVARLNKAGAAGGRGKNCGAEVVDVVLPTLALTMCAVRSGIGVFSRVS
jgi:hypothetical protein